MLRAKADKIDSLIREIFNKLEVDKVITDYAARGILHTSLRGVDTHGLRLLHHYVQGMKEGRINKKPNIKFTSNSIATSIMDADHSLGYSAGMIAMKKAIEIAKQFGIAAVSVKNSSHCGALSYYCEEAAKNDMIGMAFTHATSKLKTPNSKKEFFGTNPICFCAPMENNKSVCFDSAQSFISFHEVLDSRVERRELKKNIAADEHGNLTDNPNQATQLIPIGDYKGFGYAMLVDILCGLLTGMNTGDKVTKMYAPMNEKRFLGQFFMAIKIDVFEDINLFKKRLSNLCNRIHKLPSKDGKIYIPGEKELEIYNYRIVNGIPLSQSDFEKINMLQEEFNIENIINDD
tara:strand:+ start:1258 stop:2298 length:1041 start_codon:yes stop_codon:yes gene_type:complete